MGWKNRLGFDKLFVTVSCQRNIPKAAPLIASELAFQ